MPGEWLPCLNCKAAVDPAQAKVFAGVFCCPTCYLVAQRLEERCTRELKMLLITQREAIRIALIEGKLVLGPAEANRELSKQEVFQEIVRLQEGADRKKASRAENVQPAVRGLLSDLPAPGMLRPTED